MPDELVDICDSENNLTGVQKMKSEAHRDGLWHRAAHVWVYNDQGEILLQLRAKNKDLYPDMWDISVAGHVSAGEDPLLSAVREVQEELGLPVESKDLQFGWLRPVDKVFREIKNKELCYVYFLRFDGLVTDLKIQEEELQDIAFVPTSELRESLQKRLGKYVFEHDEYWEQAMQWVEADLIKK